MARKGAIGAALGVFGAGLGKMAETEHKTRLAEKLEASKQKREEFLLKMQSGYRLAEIEAQKGPVKPKIEKGIDPETGKEVFVAVSETGATPIPGAAPRPAKPAAEVNVTNKSESSFAKEFGKLNATQFFEQRQKAEDAKQSLGTSREALKLLNSGVITGTGADFLVSFGKFAERIGFDAGTDIDNSQAFLSAQAKQVATIIKAFGAGTGLSDADREYAEKAAAGKINLSEDAIRKIIDINDRAATNTITMFNKQVADLPEGISPFELKIDLPETGANRVTIDGKTFTRPPDFTDQQWTDYKQSQGVQ